jgi:hypothetical protein
MGTKRQAPRVGEEVRNLLTGERFTFLGAQGDEVHLDSEGHTHKVDRPTFREFFSTSQDP